jgi:Threonine dehydrogenase and related Zn-dependent dehydrogenases
VGDWVLAPFRYSDGNCDYCRRGMTASCVNGGFWSREVLDAGQGEYVRVPFADATLVRPTGPGGGQSGTWSPASWHSPT